ncbi:hypothetical protein A5685_10290 [Mycobacterium colombiense]|uniref:Uncharacterized protein n=1 Tax=Mycobacterium colombiense TaxID=339268 RepID=A0A1A2RV25_9MYCO|nr:hypothetical protein [Mycobacterium colombiense]OBH55826.1 hypothetical protein A5685_10290 [Mycobacterium colombiense]
MTVMQRPAAGLSAVREVAFPLVAVAIIVASTDIRIPLGLPGHRGLIWLTMLVAVVLVTARRETVLAVGVAASIAALPMHGDPLWSSRYVGAAILLYAVASLPVVRVRRWLLAVVAAPIHLVALASSVFSWHSGPVMSAWASNGMLERAGWHLVFGLVAGLLAWAVALCLGRPPSVWANAIFDGSRYKERPL